MESTPKRQPALSAVVCTVISGTALGVLVGLSASPVIQTVVGGLMAVVAGVAAALAGIEKAGPTDTQQEPDGKLSENHSEKLVEKARRPETPGSGRGDPDAGKVVRRRISSNPAPVAYLLVGLLCGSLVGIYARTHDWFGPDLDGMSTKWTKSGLLDKKWVYEKLFLHFYPSGPEAQNSPELADRGVLFAGVPAEICKQLRSEIDKPEQLRQDLSLNKDQRIVDFAKTCRNPDDLKQAVIYLICPGEQY